MMKKQNYMVDNYWPLNENNKKKKDEGICVIFRKRDVEWGCPVMIQCLMDEKSSEIIKRYRSMSGDNDPNNKFIFNGKKFDYSLTVSEIGFQNNSNIFVIPTKGVEGAGCIMLFSDVSKNETKEIGFSKDAPSYRKACKGINIFGICHCKLCNAYNKEVVVRIKKNKFDLINEKDQLFCPECESTIIPKTVGFYLCRFHIYGKKIIDDKIIPFDNCINEAHNKNSVTYFDPDLNGEVCVSQLIFEVLEYF